MGDRAKAIFLGRLTRDPGHRRPGQDPVNFGIAINTRGENNERVDFFECEAWGAGGAAIREFCRKGARVYIEAIPYVAQWKGQDGHQRREVRFKVMCCEFLAKSGDAPQETPAPNEAPMSGDNPLSSFL